MEAFYLFLGVLVIVGGAAAEKCKEQAAYNCVKDMLHSYLHHSGKMDCKLMKESEACLLEVYDRCLNEVEKARARQQMDNMMENVRAVCGPNGQNKGMSDEDRRMVECVQNQETLSHFLRECTDKTLEKLYDTQVPMTKNLRDAQCDTFLSIAHCVTKKVGDRCGKRVEGPFYYGMLLGLKSTDAAHSPRCAAAIQEFTLDDALQDFNLGESHRVEGVMAYGFLPSN